MPNKLITDLDTGRLLVAPSILAADFADLGNELKRVMDAGADMLHLDVMDGHFVPNLTIGPPLIKSIRKVSDALFDAHLMITDPLKYIASFADAGADHISFHIESNDDPEEVIDGIRNLGCTVGITVKPKTPASAIIPFLDKLDLVLVMTVEPGFGGQSFMKDMMPKVREIRDAVGLLDRSVHIQVDGGIDSETVACAAGAGANIMVAGTSVFRNPEGAKAAIETLHSAEKNILRI